MTSNSNRSAAAVLIALRRWTHDSGISNTTTWRWIQRGWLGKPFNIAGKLYLSRDQIEEFNRRAQAGEFRGPPSGAARTAAEKRAASTGRKEALNEPRK